MFNADGSQSEMCGNGIRCVANMSTTMAARKENLTIETGRGVLNLQIQVQDGQARWITSTWASRFGGRPDTHHAGHRSRGDLPPIRRQPLVTCVSMGNLHCVAFVRQPPISGAGVGTPDRTGPRFPRRTNVEFVEVLSPVEVEGSPGARLG